MRFLEVANTRYTTKKYDEEKRLSSDIIAELQEVLRLSPSSINSQPWKFIIVGDEVLKNSLAEASMHNTKKMQEASHIVVFAVINSIEAFERQITANLPQGAVDYYLAYVKPLGESEIKQWWERQVYLALGFFLAACGEMGVDSTPMEGITPSDYDRILDLEGYRTLVAVSIGYRDESDANQPRLKPKARLPLADIVEVR